MSRRPKPTKIVDTESGVRCASGTYGIRREEVWINAKREVVRYNLAFIHHLLCSFDNGRVLGYDNAHGVQERHWMGTVTVIENVPYDAVLERFQRELDEIRRTA